MTTDEIVRLASEANLYRPRCIPLKLREGGTVHRLMYGPVDNRAMLTFGLQATDEQIEKAILHLKRGTV